MDAHTPWASPPGFRHRWPGRSPRLPSYGLPTAADVVARRRPITVEERDHLRALYDDALSYLDQEVGRLLAFLEAQPDGGRTCIIVTADHGEALGEHDRLGHNCVLYDQVLHVPLIVRFPTASGPWAPAAQPAVDPRPIPLVGLMPMVLSLAGGGGPAPPAGSGRDTMVATVDCFSAEDGPPSYGASGAALVTDGLKYIEEAGRPPLLFDLDRDPDEGRDLAAARPAEADRLRAELARWREGMRRVPAAAGDVGLTDRDDALRALGYVQ
jgi:arylsulfatase A-like enzyme